MIMKEASRYNIWEENVLYNSFTDQLITFLESEVPDVTYLLNNLDEFEEEYPELFDSFQKFGFIKDVDFDELEYILFQNRKVVFNSEHYHLTINPTLQCNYKCWYCCVEDQGTVYRKERMNDHTIEKLKMHIKYMIEKEHISSLLLDWFGGEPLMYFYEVIYPISLYAKSLCISHGVQLTSHITTNAYFIDYQMLATFKEINVSSFQIPVDGGRRKHNSVKNHNGLGHFDKIMNNINSICEHMDDVSVVVRINYDLQSLKTISSVIKDIKQENKEKIIVDFQRVWQVEFSRDSNGDNIQLLKVKKEFESAGFKTVYFAYKQKKFTCCYSDRFFHRVINYDGKVFKCSARNYDDDLCIAVLNDDGTMSFNHNLISKMFSDSTFRNDKCLNCNMLPLCYGPCIQKYYETKTGEATFHCLQMDSEISFKTYIKNRVAKINI